MTKPAIANGMPGRIAARIPAIGLVRTYERSWLRPDVLAAVTVWALLVPQALAYAQLAQVDAVVGLYAAMGAAIGYVLLGGVRSMNVGPGGDGRPAHGHRSSPRWPEATRPASSP